MGLKPKLSYDRQATESEPRSLSSSDEWLGGGLCCVTCDWLITLAFKRIAWRKRLYCIRGRRLTLSYAGFQVEICPILTTGFGASPAMN
jgi:hypothetical protein